jgi:apolipoprotein N-acyltransferase
MMPTVMGLAAGVVGGAFFILASPSYGVWWLGLLALLPVYYVRLVSRRPGVVLASAVFALAFAFHNAKWYFTVMADARVLAFLACLGFALLYFIVIEAAARAGRRRPALAPLALPVLWVGVDLLRTTIPGVQLAWFPLFAHTQVGNVALLQIASWGGAHAVTFIALGLAAAAAHWLTRPLNPFRAAWAGLFVAAYAAIWWNGAGVAKAADVGPKFGVACVQNGPVRNWEDFDFLADYERLTDEATAGAAVDVVVWPETIFANYDDDSSRAAIGATARRRGVYIVYDGYEKAAGGSYNVAVLVAPDGREVLKWRKRHPAPGERSLTPGPDEPYGVYDAPWGTTGLLICYDDHFPGEARRLAAAGARVLLIPSNDHGYGDDYFYRVHQGEAVFRAAENRCAVAVAGYDGFSAIANGAGRVLARKDDHRAGFITAMVAAGRGGAFYTRHPHLFSWLLGLAAAAVLLGGVTGRRD